MADLWSAVVVMMEHKIKLFALDFIGSNNSYQNVDLKLLWIFKYLEN